MKIEKNSIKKMLITSAYYSGHSVGQEAALEDKEKLISSASSEGFWCLRALL